MAKSSISDAELRRLTNIDELLGPRQAESKAEVPTAPALDDKGPPDVSLRSTTDPLQINFASADMAGGLQKSNTKPFVRMFAWTFLAGPGFIWAAVMLYNLVVGFPSDPNPRQVLAGVFGVALVIVIGGFWPFVLTRRG